MLGLNLLGLVARPPLHMKCVVAQSMLKEQQLKMISGEKFLGEHSREDQLLH